VVWLLDSVAQAALRFCFLVGLRLVPLNSYWQARCYLKVQAEAMAAISLARLLEVSREYRDFFFIDATVP
jgi:hypothetical protein